MFPDQKRAPGLSVAFLSSQIRRSWEPCFMKISRGPELSEYLGHHVT